MFALQFIFFLILLAMCAVGVYKSLNIKMTSGEPEVGKVNFKAIVAIIVAFILGLNVIWGGMGTISPGSRGVVLNLGRVTGEIKGEGFYVVVPILYSVESMSVRIQKHEAEAAAASKDLQNVKTVIALNFRVDPERADKVFQSMRRDYETLIIDPTVREAVKATTAKYNAEQLITERAIVRDEISSALLERLSRHGILVDQMSIADFAFDADFSKAIEEKMVAAQVALKAENELRTAKVQAESRVATAQGEAEAIKIQAQAIQTQGGAEYVRLKAIEKWDGVLPVTMLGGAPVPFVNVNK